MNHCFFPVYAVQISTWFSIAKKPKDVKAFLKKWGGFWIKSAGRTAAIPIGVAPLCGPAAQRQ
jgi:hypothetical protein